MKRIAILGSTGSIGTQTLDVVRNNKDMEVVSLAAGSNIELLEQQIREFRPKVACVWDPEKAEMLRGRMKDLQIRVVSGMDGLIEAAVQEDADVVVGAVVGLTVGAAVVDGAVVSAGAAAHPASSAANKSRAISFFMGRSSFMFWDTKVIILRKISHVNVIL